MVPEALWFPQGQESWQGRISVQLSAPFLGPGAHSASGILTGVSTEGLFSAGLASGTILTSAYSSVVLASAVSNALPGRPFSILIYIPIYIPRTISHLTQPVRQPWLCSQRLRQITARISSSWRKLKDCGRKCSNCGKSRVHGNSPAPAGSKRARFRSPPQCWCFAMAAAVKYKTMPLPERRFGY